MRKFFLLAVFSMVTSLILIYVSVGAFAAGGADEHYWPQWRGPNFDGVAPSGNPPIEWSETKNIAWKVGIPGNGFGTPVVWEDTIFILSAVPVTNGGPLEAFSSVASQNQALESTAESPRENNAGIGSAPLVQPTKQRGQRRRPGRRQAEPLQAMDFTVMALSRTDGSLIWSDVARHETPHEGKQTNNSWASSSAITDGEHVFAFFGSRGLYAYDMKGNSQWNVDFGDMRIRNGFGEGTSPALHGETLVVVWDHQGDSFIVALDKNTGSELWRQSRDEPESWATPLVVEFDGRAQVITAGQNRTYSYYLDTGDLVWEGPGLTVNPIPSPVEADGIVYMMSGYRGEALRAVRLADAQGDISDSPAILWEYNHDTPYVPSPLLYDGTLYFLKSNSPILTAFDVASGQAYYGPQRLDGLQEIYSSPVGAAGHVYFLGRDGGALVISNAGKFEILAKNNLDDGFEASPAIVGDELYLRGRQFLYRVQEIGQPDS
jgi:outer membrane protein assembly factor BamB